MKMLLDRLASSTVFLSLKFVLLLLGLSWKMFVRSWRDAGVQKHLGNKELVFQLQTKSGRVCRHFCVSKQRISSHWGGHAEPALTIIFSTAIIGTRILTADGKRLAFMQGMQNEEVGVEGDLSLFPWYVELGSMLNRQ